MSQRAVRAELDESLLPGNAQRYVGRFDALLERFDLDSLIENDLPALRTALTPTDEEEPVR